MEKFSKFLKIVERGNYIFHIHTTYVDGKDDVIDYANAFKGRMLLFSEHIRKKPTYNWRKYLNEVHANGCLGGFEAKVLEGGYLDIPHEAIMESDFIAVAVHSYNGSDLIHDLRTLFERFSHVIPLIWVHPFHAESERKLGLSKIDYILMVVERFENIVFVENNISKRSFTKDELKYLMSKNIRIIEGYDAHSVDELKLLLNFRCSW